MTEPAAPPVAAAAESDAVALVTAVVGGDDPGVLRAVVAEASPPRRLLTAFLLAERAVAAAAGRARECGAADGGRTVAAAALHARDAAPAAALVDALGVPGEVAAGRGAAARLLVALAGGAAGTVRQVLAERLGPGVPPPAAAVFCGCLAELTAAVLTVVSEQRGEPVQAYLRRWGLELAADPAARGERTAGTE